MSKISRRLTVLFLILALSVSSIACGGQPGATPELTPQEIVSKSVTANSDIESCKLDMTMSIAAEATGAKQPVNFNMSVDADGAIDSADQEMQLTMNMKMNLLGQTKIETAVELYAVDGWMYTKLAMPSMWTKTKLTDEMFRKQNLTTQQIEFLKAATNVNSLGTEVVDGTTCYVLSITPDAQSLLQWLSQQGSLDSQGLDLDKLNILNAVKKLSVKEWIAKDTFLIRKVDIELAFEITPGDVGAPAGEFDKMTMDMTLAMRLFDYNVPVAITLPPDALSARETPSQ